MVNRRFIVLLLVLTLIMLLSLSLNLLLYQAAKKYYLQLKATRLDP